MSSCLKMEAVCSLRDICSTQRLPEVKPCDIRMGFIQQSHDQRVGGEEPRADPISHFFYLLSPTVLPGRRHYNVRVKKTLSQKTLWKVTYILGDNCAVCLGGPLSLHVDALLRTNDRQLLHMQRSFFSWILQKTSRAEDLRGREGGEGDGEGGSDALLWKMFTLCFWSEGATAFHKDSQHPLGFRDPHLCKNNMMLNILKRGPEQCIMDTLFNGSYRFCFCFFGFFFFLVYVILGCHGWHKPHSKLLLQLLPLQRASEAQGQSQISQIPARRPKLRRAMLQ